MENMKEVCFYPYCETCEHLKKDESEEPCCDCLEIPVRPNSHRPEYYKKAEGQQADQNDCKKAVKKQKLRLNSLFGKSRSSGKESN